MGSPKINEIIKPSSTRELEAGSFEGIESTLRPMPTNDPEDPLNWPRWKKYVTLAHVSAFYFLFTFLTTVTVPTFPALQEIFNATYAEINYTVAVPALSLALSPLMWSPLADRYGRRIIMIIGCLIAFISTIGSAVAKSYSGYMAARFFQGWGVGPASSVGLQIILDMFFEHDRGQKTGYWTLAIDLGLLFGPLIGGFAALVSTEFVAWLTAILFGTLLISMILFLPETAYPRQKSDGDENSSGDDASNIEASRPPRPKLPFLNFRTIPGIKAPQPWDTTVRFFRMFAYPNVAISIMFYCWSWYWFILCVITMIPAAYPTYTAQVQGLLFLGLILGTVVGEAFFSGTLSDRIVAFISRTRKQPRTPEMRLWLFWPASILSSVGLVIFGLSIHYGWHWIVGQVGMAAFALGIQVGNTIATTYAIDCHPEHVMDVVVFYSFHLNLSAFASPFWIVPLVDMSGWAWAFSSQAIIIAGCTILCVGFLQLYGERLRNWKGPISWSSAL
ncbi:hypothetical protein FRC02_006581 [Tulasnella sp. 418]|nr:hypothetical protein FRC02_006581 [Tulasnella sp. 418]